MMKTTNTALATSSSTTSLAKTCRGCGAPAIAYDCCRRCADAVLGCAVRDGKMTLEEFGAAWKLFNPAPAAPKTRSRKAR